jgi:phage tail-like protein
MRSSGIPLGLSFVPGTISNWTNGVRTLDPHMAFNFAVEIEGLLVGGFTEVSGLESEIETETYEEGGVNDYIHHLPRQTTHANLILKHGLTDISSLWNWYYNATQGIIQRKNGTIMLLDRQQIPVMWWNFCNALPVKWTGPEFEAGSESVAFESIEMVHEGLSKPLLGQAASLVRGVAQMAGFGGFDLPR